MFFSATSAQKFRGWWDAVPPHVLCCRYGTCWASVIELVSHSARSSFPTQKVHCSIAGEGVGRVALNTLQFWKSPFLQSTVVGSRGGGRARSLYATPPSPPPPPPPRVLKWRGGHGANGAKNFVPCLVERGTMPLVVKTLETFFLAKTRYRYYRIHTSIPPCPQTPPGPNPNPGGGDYNRS